jgi:hypothetical protein
MKFMLQPGRPADQGRSGSFSAWLALSRYNLLLSSARTREYFSSAFGYTERADLVTGGVDWSVLLK